MIARFKYKHVVDRILQIHHISYEMEKNDVDVIHPLQICVHVPRNTCTWYKKHVTKAKIKFIDDGVVLSNMLR